MIITTQTEREYEPEWNEVNQDIKFITIDEDGMISGWTHLPKATGRYFKGYWQSPNGLSQTIGNLPGTVVDWEQAFFTRPVTVFNNETITDQKEWGYIHRGEFFTLTNKTDSDTYRVVHIGDGQYRMVSEKTANVWNTVNLFGGVSWVRVK